MLYCDTCFQANLSATPDNVIVNGGLNASTDYLIRITDKFGNRYTQQVTTDADGNFTLPVNETYPPGFFTAYSGIFEIQASLTTGTFGPKNFTFSTVTYDCIQVEFSNDNQEVNTIQ